MISQEAQMLAKGFLIFAAIVGVPAAIGSCYFGFTTYRMAHAGPKPPPTPPSGKGGPIITGLEMMDYAAGKAGRVFDAAAFGISKGLLVGSVCGLLFAAGLYFTSQGLYAGQMWSRIAGGGLLAIVFLFSLLVVLSRVGGLISILALGTMGLGGYGLWVVTRRFA
ncbi:hypothetical protein [Paludibaculum fermentans]|uniref:Uncharacterized protein n=1 Tax=Paludibaculum fermentans TaxID=1473598 RepID=A0A7S7NQQ5_PALFE|nr:hypothetical protein [Paludibaculum fermentans]QOY88052.1 hypothetical protein IRI77_35845 [Paludibaculum fermentans]